MLNNYYWYVRRSFKNYFILLLFICTQIVVHVSHEDFILRTEGEWNLPCTL